jgi:hypothetical protein
MVIGVRPRDRPMLQYGLVHRLSCFVDPTSSTASKAWQFDEYDSHRP